MMEGVKNGLNFRIMEEEKIYDHSLIVMNTGPDGYHLLEIRLRLLKICRTREIIHGTYGVCG